MQIEVNKIKPDKDQPRKTFDEESLKFLEESILSNELITPIDVDEDYVIIDGERRWKAHKIAGLKTILVRIVKLKKDKKTRLKRQLISDLQDEEIPTGEKYQGIVKLYKMENPETRTLFGKELGISAEQVSQALDYVGFSKEEPELSKSVSPHIITETKSLPKEEREEIIKEFKEVKDKKKDLIRELVKGKKEEIKTKKELEEATKKLGKKEIKITTDRDRLFRMRDEIIETQRSLNKLKSDIRWMGKTKFYLNTPKQKESFIRFLEGAIDGSKIWTTELEELKERIDIEITRE